MIKAGLTGGIGSGKSFIAQIFMSMGIPVFNSDRVAAELMLEAEQRTELENIFGKEVFTQTQTLNRKLIREKIFSDVVYREKLNALIHPLVQNSFERWCSEQSTHWVIKEAAILFESGADNGLDTVILVKAPEALRIKRVENRDGISEQMIRQIISTQWSDDQKEKQSEYVVVNDEVQMLLPQIIQIHSHLMGRSAAR
ncbi:MAG TPA: dephospho-CoA kinase [Bacteroidia bacterium]|nr:dephospho-CoA kinase [Bacteroidia bacterium]